jgi:hypothetical protein
LRVFGHVRFPVTPAKARKLASFGQPARFGRGEQTLTDPDVRDTWEIPKDLLRAEWNDAALMAAATVMMTSASSSKRPGEDAAA